MPQFAETKKLLEGDLSKVSADMAAKNIEMWEESLSGLDSKEAKSLVSDLGSLKAELHKSKPSGDTIQKLMKRLGEATTEVGGKDEKLRGIGQALLHAKAGTAA